MARPFSLSEVKFEKLPPLLPPLSGPLDRAADQLK